VPPRSAVPPRAAGAGAAELARRLAGIAPDKVVILIGDDVPAGAAEGAVRLAHAGGYAVHGAQLTSRAAYPADDPCWAGNLKPDFARIRETLAHVEAVLLVGSRAFVAYPYRDVRPIPEGAKLFHIASAPDAFGREFPADFAVAGDVGLSLHAVAAALEPLVDTAAIMMRLTALGEARRKRSAVVRAEIEAGAADRPLSADLAVLTLLDALPRNALIASDSAATFGRVQDVMQTYPGLYFFARGGVLGCAMPAAVGAALAHDGPVVNLGGDGGAMYSPQALWSAAHYRTHTIFVVFNNTRYNVLMNVARDLGCTNAVAGRFVGMDITGPRIDYQALARSMGVPSSLASTPDEIRQAIARALAAEGPSLIEIPIA